MKEGQTMKEEHDMTPEETDEEFNRIMKPPCVAVCAAARSTL